MPPNTRWNRVRVRAGLSAAVGLGLALLLTRVAEAHARYQRSEPGAGALVSQSPTRIDIWFTQELFRREGENRIELRGPDGQPVPVGDPVVADDDRAHLSVEINHELDPGAYTVNWRSLSAEDGDSAEGEFAFTLDPAAPVTSTPMIVAGPTVSPIETVEPATGAPAPPTPTATPASGDRCALGLVPVLGLAAAGRRRRRIRCDAR